MYKDITYRKTDIISALKITQHTNNNYHLKIIHKSFVKNIIFKLILRGPHITVKNKKVHYKFTYWNLGMVLKRNIA